ncbi:MAG TPA: hypothetical protein VFO17_09805 [Acidimicrobiia bacterium]|nr:hypothetical protein [Acidimicrobiia bacterium]
MGERKWTTRSVIAAVVIAVTLAIAGTALAHDQRLDLALQQLESSRLLLVASDEQEHPDRKIEKHYSRELQAAIKAIEKAQQRVEKAMVTADSG